MSAAFQIELTPEPLPARTDLATLPFAILLANARMLGLTGILELRGEKRIFIARGNPVHVDSDLADETSELYLLRTGAIEEGDIEPARELARSRGGKIGEALLGLGLLEAHELFEHTRNRARDGLVACFQWEHGAASWEPRERFGPDILPIPVDVVRVFSDGILRFYDRRRLDKELPIDDTSRIYVVPSPRLSVSGSAIGTIESRLMSLAQGRPSLPSAAMAVGLSADDLRRRLYSLYCLGIIGFEVEESILEATPPPRSAPQVSGHVARAGTAAGGTGPFPAQTAGRGSIDAPRPGSHTAPPQPTTGSRPSQPPPPPVSTGRRPSAPAMAAPTTGRASSPGFAPPMRDSQVPPPPPPSSRIVTGGQSRASAPPPPPRAPVKALIKMTGRPTKTVAAYIEDAEMARAQNDHDAALLALEYALELEPENPFLWAEKAYTMMLRDPRGHGKEANILARDARKEDPSLPLPYVVLGMLMEQVRETERAIQMYRVALQRDPICEAAQSRLEALEDKRR